MTYSFALILLQIFFCEGGCDTRLDPKIMTVFNGRLEIILFG